MNSKKGYNMKKSVFNQIDESQSEHFKHGPIQNQDWERLITAATYLAGNYIDDRYKIRFNKGSLTFQQENQNHKVISFTVDYDNRLAEKMDIYAHLRNNRHYREHPEDFNEMVVVYIELSDYDPFIRDAIRKELDRHFLYCNPTLPEFSKVYASPQKDHHYDVVFLPKGPCRQELFYDENIYTELKHILDLHPDERPEEGVNLFDIQHSK